MRVTVPENKEIFSSYFHVLQPSVELGVLQYTVFMSLLCLSSVHALFYSIENPLTWINLKVKKNRQSKKALTLAKETHWAPCLQAFCVHDVLN